MKTLDRFRGPRISVDNDRCEVYGICVQEAPRLFQLDRDGRLRYRRQLEEADYGQAAAAARCCPMQAIVLRGMSDE
ncbi:ferredoxin [Amycolatopsis acidiphila]|uniref:ferredoxin n=1 Tax=Amycolatopsis acidiphila TaxID=715473 RepID=UPI001643D1D9|nr:ferredoxin [Amycolatopsis acidiphila]UIJ58089.1 ferredoxin [Amycolatopsis acidiphila]GHG70150.1 ferredoxin [Amycolatopsis acidiphila]